VAFDPQPMMKAKHLQHRARQADQGRWNHQANDAASVRVHQRQPWVSWLKRCQTHAWFLYQNSWDLWMFIHHNVITKYAIEWC